MKTGLAVGTFAAVVHIGWAALVALGWGQGFLDFIFSIHMVEPVYTVGAFDFATALILVVVTAVIGFIVGSVFARVWNSVGKS